MANLPAGPWTLYNGFRLGKNNGTFDLDGDTFKVLLLSSAYTPALTHNVLANLTGEPATANGYTAGGATVTVSLSGTTTITLSQGGAAWTAAGGSIGPVRYAVLYKVGTASGLTNPLVGYFVLNTTNGGTDVTATDGNNITLNAGAFATES